MAETPLNDFGIADLAVLIRRRKVASVELVEACLAEIGRTRRAINAFVAIDEKASLAQARALDGMAGNGEIAGPLHGVPVAVKDNFRTRDFPTTACSKVLEGEPAGMDATAVARLREAGAIVIGKTNMHEWAYGATNEVSSFGPARNPWNPDRITGGSSGGSGAALASRTVPAALGSDTGGSVRIPAAACGVCGLKPTWGRLSRFGVLPLSWSLDVPGPMARSARDLKILFDVLAGEDPKDPATLGSRPSRPPFRGAGPRLAVLGGEGILCDADVESALEDALRHLVDSGSSVGRVEVPGIATGFAAWKVIMLAEAAAWHAGFLERHADRYSDNVRLQLEAGRCIAAVDYLKAQQYRARFTAEVQAVLDRFDAIVMPTLPVAAPRLGEQHLTIRGRRISSQDAMTSMCWIANMTGLPAVSIPTGASREGLPVALTLMGPAFAEELILDIAETFQAATDWHNRKPPEQAWNLLQPENGWTR